MKNILKALIVSGWIAGVNSAIAAVPGALESFPTLENAESWSVFDYADDGVYYAYWQEESDPYLYFFHESDEPLWFFTDQTGSADWLGDYETASIQSIQVDVYIDSLEGFEQLDCAVFTDGPAGPGYYYSETFIDSDFSEAGWWSLTFDLETTWYYFDDGWNAVDMEPKDFREVEEIGFRFFPKLGTTVELLAAIDEVRLSPLVEAPVLEYSKMEDEFVLEFTPLPANSCFIEELSGAPTFSWEKVGGQTNLTGPDAHIFSTPLAAGRGVFRIGAEARYTQVVID